METVHDLPLILHDIIIIGCLLSFAQVQNLVTVQIITEECYKLNAHDIRKELEAVSNLPLFFPFCLGCVCVCGGGGGAYRNTNNVVINMGSACSCWE